MSRASVDIDAIAERLDAIEARLELLEDSSSPKLSKRSRSWVDRQIALRDAAHMTWAFLFKEPWPSQLSVNWVPFLHGKRLGQAHVGGWTGGSINLNYAALSKHANPLAVLTHEFFHARSGAHSKKFRVAVNRALAKLSLPADCDVIYD